MFEFSTIELQVVEASFKREPYSRVTKPSPQLTKNRPFLISHSSYPIYVGEVYRKNLTVDEVRLKLMSASLN